MIIHVFIQLWTHSSNFCDFMQFCDFGDEYGEFVHEKEHDTFVYVLFLQTNKNCLEVYRVDAYSSEIKTRVS
jgi:hypothetical protein